MQRQAHGQGATHRTQLTRERQLAGKLMAGQTCAVELPAGRQNAQGDGQIKTTRVFGQIGRGQVDGDAFVVRKLQPRVLDGRAHALARLFHLHVGQPHQREAGQAIGQVDLYRDSGGLQPEQGAALHQRKTHTDTSLFRCKKIIGTLSICTMEVRFYVLCGHITAGGRAVSHEIFGMVCA